MVRYTEREFKSILNKRKYADSWFWDRYSINPYNGCQFGCVYCDSRSLKYRLPTDFENDIIVKRDVGEMLDRRLSRARTLLPDVVGMSGSTDPYQAAEGRYGNTRQCLEVLAEHRYPVHIATKSTLVLGDLDILDRIGGDTWCAVSFTITTTRPELARFLEKRTPPPAPRFDALRTIKERAGHIQAGVFLIPVVPFLCDSEGDLERVIAASREAGADYVLFGGGMTMRDSQALWFMKHLAESFPELVPAYEELYGFRYDPDSYGGSYEPARSYQVRINRTLFGLCERYGMPCRIRRFIPEDFRRDNYRIAEKLLNRAYRRQMLGKAWSNIHWAGMNVQNLAEPIADVAARGELRSIRNVNENIEAFILDQLEVRP